jgi:hypothetical protein
VPGIRVGNASVAGDERWPRVLLFPTVADLEETLGKRVASRIVLLDDLPDGYERYGAHRSFWTRAPPRVRVAVVRAGHRRSRRIRRDEPATRRAESGGVR